MSPRTAQTHPEPGDLVVVPGHHVGERERIGEILELLGDPARSRFRVRWDDGHESIVSPSGDLLVRHNESAEGEEMTGQTASKTLLDQLDQAGVAYELLPHRRTGTAAAEAEALGIEPSQVAKTLVLVTRRGYVIAVLPASERLDLRKARAFLGGKDVELASEAQLAGAYPEFELGAVPPSGSHGDRVLVDVRVRRNEYAVIEAGTHRESLRIKTDDLIALNHAVVTDLCCD